jgi:antitoxin component of MazEF toxin-antitoxin module
MLGKNMIIKQLTQSGNSKAIVIDKILLQAAGLDEDALFQVIINPNGGMLIQSVQPTNNKLVKSAFRKVMKKNYNLLKRLADK